MNSERSIIGIAKAAAFVIVWLTLAVLIFRYGVGVLWGSGSDLGMIAAPLLAAAGIVLLALLAVAGYRRLRKDFQ